MSFYLPLISEDVDYTFDTELEGYVVQFRIRWNETAQAWYADMSAEGTDLNLKGVKLVGGVDLLSPFAVLDFGQMYVVDQEGTFTDPSRDTLGDRHQVVYLTIEESNVIIV